MNHTTINNRLLTQQKQFMKQKIMCNQFLRQQKQNQRTTSTTYKHIEIKSQTKNNDRNQTKAKSNKTYKASIKKNSKTHIY